MNPLGETRDLELERRYLDVRLEEALGATQAPDLRMRVLAAARRGGAAARSAAPHRSRGPAEAWWWAAAVLLLGTSIVLVLAHRARPEQRPTPESGERTAPPVERVAPQSAAELRAFLRTVVRLEIAPLGFDDPGVPFDGALRDPVIVTDASTLASCSDPDLPLHAPEPPPPVPVAAPVPEDAEPVEPEELETTLAPEPRSEVAFLDAAGRVLIAHHAPAEPTALRIPGLGTLALPEALGERLVEHAELALRRSERAHGLVRTSEDLQALPPLATTRLVLVRPDPAILAALPAYSKVRRVHAILDDAEGVPLGDALAKLCALPALEALGVSSLASGELPDLTLPPRLEELVLSHVTLRAAHFAAFAALPRLRKLDLAGCGGVDDEAALELAECRALRWLSIADTAVSRLGVRILAKSTRLETLHAGGLEDLENGALALLAGLASLRELVLIASPGLTDADLLALARLPALTRLDVRGCTALTRAGVAAFRSARPQCSVECDPPTR